MVKLFVTDLDGTLLNKDHKLDDYIISGIKKIINNGYYFCAATGRAPNSPTLPGVDDVCYHIFFNGAYAKDLEGKVFQDVLLDKNIISDLIYNFPDIYFEFCSDTGVYCPRRVDGYMELMDEFFSGDRLDGMEWRRDFINSRVRDVEFGLTMDEICKKNIYKCNIISDPVDPNHKYIRGLREFIRDNSKKVVNNPFMQNAFELTDPKGNKGDAVKKLCRLLNIKEDEVYVYGDGLNDVPMLSAFKNAFAPCTAMEEAKEAAGNIIGPYDEYSVINHMLGVL